MTKRIEQLIRPEIRALTAYGVADPGDLIKLDAMENPYPWPEDIKRAWADKLVETDINRYPDPGARALKPGLRKAMAVPDDVEILLGNGSDEIIQMILLAMAQDGATVLSPAPSFVMYDMTARFVGMNYVSVPLKADDFALDMPAMLAAIEQHNPAVIFLAYPNNPTGNLFARDDVETIINAAKGLVVIDEAYYAFASDSYMSRVTDYDNVVVMRTVSKLGLAGLRLGLLAGNPAWLQEFDKVRMPYNVNSLTQASVEFALANAQFLHEQTDKIRSERQRVYDALIRIPDMQAWPSEANFILFRSRDVSGDMVFESLKQAGVLIKNLSHASPLLKDCLRTTIGTPEENDVFLKAVAEF
ncbi:MAG: histidinol-phosphate transaminase [Proteobacteria bacterium]|nr:histidinol-phosphate transaminase [Pseudomonadota bacterium]